MITARGDPGDENYPIIIILAGLTRLNEQGEDRPLFLDGYTVNESEVRLPVHLDLQSALPALSLPQREAVAVWVTDGRTETEAARQLRISRQTLRERVRGALLRLRRVLNGEGGTTVQDPARQPRERFVPWEKVRDELQLESPHRDPEATAKLARHIARGINNNDRRMRYRDKQFRLHERPSGLSVDRRGPLTG